MKNNWFNHSRYTRSAGPRWLPTILFLILALCAVMGSGCSSTVEAQKESLSMQITKETSEGDVKLRTTLDRQVVQVAQPINLQITAQAPEGFSVQFPDTPDSLGRLQIVDVREQLDVPLEKDRIWKRDYKLESLVSGKKTIPPIKVSYVDRRTGRPIRGVVISAPIEVEIASLLEGQADPTKFRDIKGIVDIPQEKIETNSWLTYGISAGGIFLVAGILLLFWHRHHRKNTPAEWALKQLAELEQSALLESGDTHIFYCCLTDIIRHYIEGRFGYRAPKQTTTEFLSAVQRENLLCEEHRVPLQEFLQVADMVKFACHNPSRVEADAAIDKAREFVQDTADESNNATDSAKEQVAA